jgi:hypothetical protein
MNLSIHDTTSEVTSIYRILASYLSYFPASNGVKDYVLLLGILWLFSGFRGELSGWSDRKAQ